MTKKEFNRKIMATYRGNIGNAANELLANVRSMAAFIADREVDSQTRMGLLKDWREACVQLRGAQKILQNEMASLVESTRLQTIENVANAGCEITGDIQTGTILYHGTGYYYKAVLHDDNSKDGIDGGRIIKLHIRMSREKDYRNPILQYDHGWDGFPPKTTTAKALLKIILAKIPSAR